jgi:hypothetical protein
MILCDFFPLYDFQMDTCAPLTYRDRDPHNSDEDSVASLQVTIGNKTVPYWLQRRDRPAITEYILAGWIFTLLCEEFRQVV